MKSKTVKAAKTKKPAVKKEKKVLRKGSIQVAKSKEIRSISSGQATVKTLKSVDNSTLPEDKQQIIELFAKVKGDTGSPEVQVALLSHKIERLSDHLEENKKDNHSRRGLLKVIAKRRRILNYLQKLDEERYKDLIRRLGLKK